MVEFDSNRGVIVQFALATEVPEISSNMTDKIEAAQSSTYKEWQDKDLERQSKVLDTELSQAEEAEE